MLGVPKMKEMIGVSDSTFPVFNEEEHFKIKIFKMSEMKKEEFFRIEQESMSVFSSLETSVIS